MKNLIKILVVLSVTIFASCTSTNEISVSTPVKKNTPFHNELHDNWSVTNKSNVIYVNWMYSSYGVGPNDQINR